MSDYFDHVPVLTDEEKEFLLIDGARYIILSYASGFASLMVPTIGRLNSTGERFYSATGLDRWVSVNNIQLLNRDKDTKYGVRFSISLALELQRKYLNSPIQILLDDELKVITVTADNAISIALIYGDQ